eukprot:761500-Hanusia_phi.AAC.3
MVLQPQGEARGRTTESRSEEQREGEQRRGLVGDGQFDDSHKDFAVDVLIVGVKLQHDIHSRLVEHLKDRLRRVRHPDAEDALGVGKVHVTDFQALLVCVAHLLDLVAVHGPPLLVCESAQEVPEPPLDLSLCDVRLDEVWQGNTLRQILDVHRDVGGFQPRRLLALPATTAGRATELVLIVEPAEGTRDSPCSLLRVSVSLSHLSLRCKAGRGRHRRVLRHVQVLLVVGVQLRHGHVVPCQLRLVMEVLSFIVTVLYSILSLRERNEGEAMTTLT